MRAFYIALVCSSDFKSVFPCLVLARSDLNLSDILILLLGLYYHPLNF